LLTHAITDWMGDDGWLFNLRCEHRGFNYIGDTTWVRGSVVHKVQVDGRAGLVQAGCCPSKRRLNRVPRGCLHRGELDV
jgi:hypothetical protein